MCLSLPCGEIFPARSEAVVTEQERSGGRREGGSNLEDASIAGASTCGIRGRLARVRTRGSRRLTSVRAPVRPHYRRDVSITAVRQLTSGEGRPTHPGLTQLPYSWRLRQYRDSQHCWFIRRVPLWFPLFLTNRDTRFPGRGTLARRHQPVHAAVEP